MNINSKKIIILVFLCTFLMLTTIPYIYHSFNQINIGSENENNLNSPNLDLKTSQTEIIINTPESKIYTKPMYGYYPGSYSFDNVENWLENINLYANNNIQKILIGNKSDLKMDRNLNQDLINSLINNYQHV